MRKCVLYKESYRGKHTLPLYCTDSNDDYLLLLILNQEKK